MRILAFVAGLTHLHHISVLQQLLPEFRFTALIYQHLAHLKETPSVKEMGIEILTHNSQDVDPAVWDPLPHLVFLSTAYPEPYRCQLVRGALQREVPILAMQEGNQQANLSGKSTHYMLPVDKLGVISPFEEEGILALGLRPEQVVVTGWPFAPGEASSNCLGKGSLRSDLGIGTGERVALLILSLLKEKQIQCFETRCVREKMLPFVAQGLPEGFRLVIKPHPADEQDEMVKLVRQCSGRAILLDKMVPIEVALGISDLVITRGNSQVMFEAMKRGLPLVVVPLGFPTLFSYELPEVVAHTPIELGNICKRSVSSVPDYSKVLLKHLPIDTKDSLDRTAGLLRETAATPPNLPRWEKSLDLCLQMKLVGLDASAEEELECLRAYRELPEGFLKVPVLVELLFKEQANPEGVHQLLSLFEGQRIRSWHVQALWIRQMYHQKLKRSKVREGLVMVKSFTGTVNSHYFIHELLMKMELAFIAGAEEEGNRLRNWFRENYYFWPPFEKQEMKLCLLKDRRIDTDLSRYWISRSLRGGSKIVGTLSRMIRSRG